MVPKSCSDTPDSFAMIQFATFDGSRRVEIAVHAALAPATDDVVAFVELREQLRYLLGFVLKVAIHRDDDVASCGVEAGSKRGGLAVVAREPDGVHAWIGRADRLDERPRRIGAAVVDVDDLGVDAEQQGHRAEAPVEFVERAGFVVERHDNREVELRRTVSVTRHVENSSKGLGWSANRGTRENLFGGDQAVDLTRREKRDFRLARGEQTGRQLLQRVVDEPGVHHQLGASRAKSLHRRRECVGGHDACHRASDECRCHDAARRREAVVVLRPANSGRSASVRS